MDFGVLVSIYEGDDFTQAFAEARQAGFTHGQVNCCITGITADEVRELALASLKADFRVDAIGCYINPLRPDDPSLNQCSVLDWRTIVENMAMLNGVERVVCWSGTLGRTLGTPNLLNLEESTFNNLFITLSGLLEQVRGIPIEIVLEPFTAHVLHDSASCCRMASKFPRGDVKVILDAPNVVPVKEFHHIDNYVEEYVKHVAPAVGLVHLKDISRNNDGHREFLPAGKGKLDYGRYLRAIAEYIPEVPLIVDNVCGLEEMQSAHEFLERILKEQDI